MQRRIVQIAKMCMADVRVGDTVGSDPNGNRGWFVVEEVVNLINGDLSLVGDRGQSSVTAAPRDVVGFQVRQTVEMAADEPAVDDQHEASGQSGGESSDESPAQEPVAEAPVEAPPEPGSQPQADPDAGDAAAA